jgi:DNA-binding NarL/FixJ family response regulator
MLMAGTPDDRAADALGVSPRTYSRRVGELTLLLGVQSRFQAGAEAARRGWLDTPSTAPTSQRR